MRMQMQERAGKLEGERERERNGENETNRKRDQKFRYEEGKKKEDSGNSKEEKPNLSCLHRDRGKRMKGMREGEDLEYRTAEVDFPTLQNK